jgi:SET domain-containing protein
MLVVKTKLKEVKKKGISLFLDEDVKKDELIYKFNSKVDLIFEHKDVPNCDPFIAFLEKHAIAINRTSFVINLDYTKFINHSKSPNVRVIKRQNILVELRANKNIKKGEEITINYYDLENELNFTPCEE